MAFQIRDLLVTVRPAGVDGTEQRQCDYKTTCFVCTRIQCSYHTANFANTELVERTAADLEVLKHEMRVTLESLELERPGVLHAREPQTIEEVEALESHLREALDELASRRREMGGRPE